MTKLEIKVQTPALLLLSILLLAPFVTGCQTGEPGESPEATPTPETEAPAEASSSGDQATEDVAYEPAYPSEVSDEGLSEEDREQQQGAHDHGSEEHSHEGGEEHSHDDEEPTHDGDDHAHDDDTHTHGDEEHSHDDGSDDDHDH